MQHHPSILPALLALVFLVFPAIVLAAAPPPSTIIPCGFDTNNDGVVQNIYSAAGPPPVIQVKEECDFDDVIRLAQNVINFLIFQIGAPLAAVMFVWAGFLYVTNRGNEGQVKQAHTIFLYVFWGFVIMLGAWIVMNFILEFFLGAGSPFNFLGP